MKLTVDGKAIEAQEGMTVFEASKAAGIYIPSLCYHPAVSPVGTCRLCAVEVQGMRGLPGSCTLPVTEGMIVHTETPRVREFRRTILENILRDHPQDCLLCSGNLQCQLQKVATYIGLEQIRLPLIHRNSLTPKDDIFFTRDYSRCIRCGRCVRVCRELRGSTAINFLLDEKGLSIGTPLDRSLQSAECCFCGACIDACPTGALAEKTYKGLPEKEVTTICPYCGVGCQINLQIRRGKVMQVVPDAGGPANHGQACVKGRFAVPEFVNHPDRLKHPLIRRNGSLEEASWNEALELVAANLAKYYSDQISVISSAKSTNEDNFVTQKFARAVLKTNNVDHYVRLFPSPSLSGLSHSFGSDAMTNSIGEIKDSACILALGTNTTVSHPIVALEIKKAVKGKGKLIVANPQHIELADIADIWMRNKPGSDAAVLMGMMHVIVEEGLQDDSFIRKYCENFEELFETLPDFDLDMVERVSGVPQELITRAARLFATTKPGSIIYSMSITQHSHGIDSVLAAANLAMLTGNIGKRSSGVTPLRRQNNTQGACDMGALPEYLSGYQPITDKSVRNKFKEAWGCQLNPAPGLTLMELPQAIRHGQIKAVYLIGGNPVLSEPDFKNTAGAPDKLEFLVVHDMFLSETAARANVVLPACSFAEVDGTYTDTERRVQRVRKAVAEVGDSRPDWWIVSQVAQRMGGKGFTYESPSQVMEEISRLTPSYAGISYQRLEQDSLQWPCPDLGHPGTPILHQDGFMRGKGQFTPLYYKPSQELPDEEYPLALTTERNQYQFHTGTWTGWIDGLSKLEELEINPQDAQKLAIKDNETVKVLSRHHETKAKVRVSEAIPPGMVSVSYHFKESPGSIFTHPAPDPEAKGPEYKVCAVRLEKIAENANV